MISAIAVQGIINSKSSQGWAASGSQAATIEVFFFFKPLLSKLESEKEECVCGGSQGGVGKRFNFFFFKTSQ